MKEPVDQANQAERRSIEAHVSAGGVETPYERAGRGPAVLLLWGNTEDPERLRAVVDTLATRLCVIRPNLVAAVWRPNAAAPPDRRCTADRWLRELVEGLGLRRPAVLVDGTTAAGLEAFRVHDADLIGPWIEIDELSFADLDDLTLTLAERGGR